jgi:2-amino-4-hydroxy-6-hydroxymethyldihydropteridine diphosphokinase
VQAYLAIGTSADDPNSNLAWAREQLANTGIHILAMSSVGETGPGAGRGEPRFLNQVLEIDTDYRPSRLLTVLDEIAAAAAARRLQDAADPPPLDISLLLYGQLTISQPGLILPHPDLINRDFLLQGLTEVNPRLTDSISGLTADQLMRQLDKEN